MTTLTRRTTHRPLEDDAHAAPARAGIRVLVVDDHPAVRIGLRRLLEDQRDFVLIDAVPTAEAAISVAEQGWLDVAVVDYQLGARSGLWLSRKLQRLPRPPGVVIYSAYCDGVLATTSVVAQADALVSKSALGSELCDAIRSVARGGQRFPPFPTRLIDMLRLALDPEEHSIFGLLVAGVPPAEIAQTLDISSGALEYRLGTMLVKLESAPLEPLSSRRVAG